MTAAVGPRSFAGGRARAYPRDMRRIVFLFPIAAASILASGCCGYGGPGCGEPGLAGLCGAQVAAESSATVVYFDDTGSHPSGELGELAVTPPELLDARRGEGAGEIVLFGKRPGSALLEIDDIEGWEGQRFAWKIEVVSEIDEALCEDDRAALAPLDPAGR